MIETAFYVRKISPAKWPQPDEFFSLDAIRADAITGDLRTTNDTLSFWKIERLEELEHAVLALASGLEDFCTVNVLAIPEEKFGAYNFCIVESKGDTPYESMEDQHFNIVDVDYESLGSVAQLVTDSIKAEEIHTTTKKNVKKMLLQAYQNGRINRNKLRDKMSERLETELDKQK